MTPVKQFFGTTLAKGLMAVLTVGASIGGTWVAWMQYQASTTPPVVFNSFGEAVGSSDAPPQASLEEAISNDLENAVGMKTGAPATVVDPEVSIENASIGIVGYAGRTYRAAMTVNFKNNSDQTISIAWLDPNRMANFTMDGSEFRTANIQSPANTPTGVAACRNNNGRLCFEKYPQQFTKLSPGQAATGILYMRLPVASDEAPRLPATSSGLFNGQVYVVRPSTGESAVQTISLPDLPFTNPALR